MCQLLSFATWTVTQQSESKGLIRQCAKFRECAKMYVTKIHVVTLLISSSRSRLKIKALDPGLSPDSPQSPVLANVIHHCEECVSF
jgi:hypothetical protein